MSDLNQLLNELQDTIAAPGFRESAKQFESDLREEPGLSREQRDALWQQYQAIWATHKQHKAERAQRAEQQFVELTRHLDEMEENLEGQFFKSLSKKLEERLASSTALFKPQRDEIWSLYQDLWKCRKEWISERRRESDIVKARYSNELYSIDFSYDGAPILQSFSNWEHVGYKVRAAREKLKVIQKAVRNDHRLFPADRNAVFGQIQEFWHKVAQAEETTFVVHGEKAAELYNEASNAVDNLRYKDASAILKANGSELISLWLPRDDRRRYKQYFDDLWQRLHSKRDEAQAVWRERQEAGLEKLIHARDKCLNALERVRANNCQNQSKLSDARSDSRRDLVSGWLREGEEKERDMERSLDELESKIADAGSRLNR
jgi:hypothetical protein